MTLHEVPLQAYLSMRYQTMTMTSKSWAEESIRDIYDGFENLIDQWINAV
jgi:hypothetical protein